jgi:TnpA family transposase
MLIPKPFIPTATEFTLGQTISTKCKKYLGFRKASSNYLKNFHKWLVERTLEHDKPTFLLQLACEKLAREKIVRIGITRLERMIATARQDAQDETHRLLLPILTREHRELLDNLLVPDADTRITKLFWLRNEAKSNNAAEILSGIKKITFLRQLGVENWDLSEINPNRLKILARIGRKATNQYIQKAGEKRRYTVLISFLHQTMIDVTDEIIDMYDQCLWDLYTDAKKDLEEFQKSIFKAMNEKLSLFKELARIVVDQEVDGQDLRSMIYGKIASPDAIRSAIEEADKMVLHEDGGHLNFFGNRYSYIRRFAPSFLESFKFYSNITNDPLLAAIKRLRDLNEKRSNTTGNNLPVGFVTEKWKPYVVNNGKANRRFYELSALWELRNGLRAGNIWLKNSRRYANINSYLIPDNRWPELKPEVCQQIKVQDNGVERLNERELELEDLFSRVERTLGESDKIRVEDEKVVVSPIVAEGRPESAISLENRIASLLPRIDLADLIIEVDHWTKFTDCFHHAGNSESRSQGFLKHLYACIFAQACNFGLEQISQSADIAYDRLAWCNNWYIREETLKAAFTKVVNYQHAQPPSRLWGGGTLSSSDGQRFPVKGKFRKAVALPKYFGYGKGVTFYTWTSDQFSQYGTKYVSSTIRDATYVLDEILNNETDLEILEHTTDTAGYTELIFALFDLLGLTFSPRIRDISNQHLYRSKAIDIKQYPNLKHQVKGIINRERILKQWDPFLRVAGSLKLGWVTASLIIQKLQAFPRKNIITRALQEYGRLVKTIFILKWYEDEAYRRRISRQLNKGEALHSLRSYLSIANQGVIKRKNDDGVTNQVNCLNLVTNSVITWNTVYMNAAIEQLKNEGHEIREKDVQHIWPTRYEHINVYGKYNFDVDERFNGKELRPLR